MESMSIIEFGAAIQRIIERRNMTRDESYRMFRELMLNSQPDLQQGAFLAALTAKGETVDEIVGAWQAIDEIDTVHVNNLPDDIVDNSGTGMDGFKTFNVSSAAALVVAANGVPIARHGARAITSRCGTVDIMEAMGINVEIDPSATADSVRSIGIGLFNGMSPLVHPGGLGRILSQIRFGTTFNIAASLASPARPKVAMRGVYAQALIDPVAQVMRKIGYRRALVVHGSIDGMDAGMDELSVCGTTNVQRIDGDADSIFTLTPEEAGLPRRSAGEIAATGSLEQESRRFLSVVAGTRRFKGCEDFVALNAGAILWMEGVSHTLSAGVADARHTLASGGALNKLRQWTACQADDTCGGLLRLQRLEQEVLV
jgi:anthranilate phosphoribosyltransferase